MFQNRDQMRAFYSQVFSKHRQHLALEPMEQMLLDVILLHPEYHEMLGDPEGVFLEEFTIENGQTNPFLHMGMHIAIREQSSIDSPKGIRALHQQLVAQLGESDAEHRMMECLGEMLWTSQRNNLPPDETAYLECLNKLIR